MGNRSFGQGLVFEILILSRLKTWKGLVLVNLLLALLFSLVTGLQKQEVAQEERVSMELVAQSYEQDGVYVESLQSEISRLRQLVKEDRSYQEELEWRVELLQEYHIYKDLYVKQWQVYQDNPNALPASHLALLKAEQVYLWARERMLLPMVILGPARRWIIFAATRPAIRSVSITGSN